MRLKITLLVVVEYSLLTKNDRSIFLFSKFECMDVFKAGICLKVFSFFLPIRRDVLDDLVTLHNFRNQFLPNALREFFKHIHAPEERGEYLETLITKFSHRFCACNPDLMRELGLSPGKKGELYPLYI